MQSPPIPDPAFSARWKAVLDQMEQALRQQEAAAAAREQELTAVPTLPLPDPDRLANLLPQLEPEDCWLRPLDDAVRQVEQRVADTSAVLQAREQALRDWLATVAAYNDARGGRQS
jgi:hypothetical protein